MELLNLSSIFFHWFKKICYFFVFWYCTLDEFLSIMFQFTHYVFNHVQLRVSLKTETYILLTFYKPNQA